MSDTRREGHRSSVKTPPGGDLPPVPRALSRGPETVINPEGRQSMSAVAADSPAPPASTIVRLLFPPAEELPNEERLAAAIGAELGHFTIVERIRTGGMGAVFKALDTRLNRIVALKVLPPIPSRDPSAVQRFRKEAQAAAQLNHENIARVYYIGEDQGLHFIAFEFVHGTNLRELIQQRGQLPVEDTLNYTLQIASALVHTSAQGVVHRDIKPSNVIITPTGRSKLVDLGLARNEVRNDGEPDLTVAGTTLGTFDYISPEQARDPRTADIRSDIYSLGCTLYHLLTAEPPYPQGTMLQKLLQHQGEEAPDPAQKNRRVPEALSAIVRKMMAKDPRRRYQTAEQLIRDLMLLAGAIGLRSLSPEGLVWMSPKSQRPSFLERYIAWIVSGAALLLFVAYLKFWPPHLNNRDTASPSGFQPTSSAGDLGNVTHAPGIPTSDRDKSSASNPGKGLSDPEPAGPTVGSRGGESPRLANLSPDAINDASLTPPPVEIRDQASASPDKPLAAGASRNPSGLPAENRIAEPLPEISVVTTDGTPRKTFLNLAAACAAANTTGDGAVVELAFNRKQQEFPFRITRKTTIRAAPGFRPIIDFVPLEVPAAGFETRMIRLSSGSLQISGVELSLTVPDQMGEPWVLFSIQRGDLLRLQGCTVTLENPRIRPAALCEIQGGSSSGMPGAGVISGSTPLDVEFSRSFLRGQGDLFCLRSLDSVKLTLQDSLVAIDGAIVLNEGNQGVAQPDAAAKLHFENSTLAFSRSLIRVDAGEIPRKLLPIRVTAKHSLFSTGTSEPLVSMAGRIPSSDFRSLLNWNGSDNHYDRVQSFWISTSTEGSGRTDSMNFADWQKLWGSSSTTSELNSRVDAVLWKQPWNSKAITALAPVDFEIAPDETTGGVVAGTAAGASLSQLLVPRISKGPAERAPELPATDNP